MTEIIVNNVKDFLLKKERLETSLKQKERSKIILELKALKKVWDKYNLKKVYLYGSFADMTFNRYSDIDTAVEPEISFEDQLRLFAEINKHIRQEVDVRVLRELPFAEKIKKTGILVYEKKDSHTQK